MGGLQITGGDDLAHNCTVTGKNIEDAPEIIRWFLAEPERTRIGATLASSPKPTQGAPSSPHAQ
jgi:hypothetical protein